MPPRGQQAGPSNDTNMGSDNTLEPTQAVLEALLRSINSMSATAQPPAAPEARVNPPEAFDGRSASNLRDFLTQLRLVFDLQPSKFLNDTIKVRYACSFLRGSVFSWIQPYLDMDGPPAWMDDFSLFAAEITRVFGDPDIIGSATRSLRKLQQTGSVAFYASEFRRHSTLLSWGEQALTSQFYEGLKNPIKDELAKVERPTELRALIDLAIRIDTRLYERSQERSDTPRSSIPAPRQPLRGHAAPTTTASFRANSAQRPGFRRPFQRLSEEQKEYRRRNNLCMYCAAADHAVQECPIRPKDPLRPTPEVRPADPTARSSGNASAQRQ
jgi:Ty3 transposon capsid-like protein